MRVCYVVRILSQETSRVLPSVPNLVFLQTRDPVWGIRAGIASSYNKLYITKRASPYALGFVLVAGSIVDVLAGTHFTKSIYKLYKYGTVGFVLWHWSRNRRASTSKIYFVARCTCKVLNRLACALRDEHYLQTSLHSIELIKSFKTLF